MCIYTYIYIMCIYTHSLIWFQMSFKKCHIIYIHIASGWSADPGDLLRSGTPFPQGNSIRRHRPISRYNDWVWLPTCVSRCRRFLRLELTPSLRKWTTFRSLKVGVPIFLEGNGESSEPSNLQRRFLLVFRRSHLKDHQKGFMWQKEWPYFWHQKSCAFHIDIVVRLARFFAAFLLAWTDAKPPARPFRDSNFKWKTEEPLKKLMDFCPPLLPRQKHPKVFELKNRDCFF